MGGHFPLPRHRKLVIKTNLLAKWQATYTREQKVRTSTWSSKAHCSFKVGARKISSFVSFVIVQWVAFGLRKRRMLSVKKRFSAL